MPLPCPGPAPISLLDIQNEFGGTASTKITEYYRGGAYVPNTADNSNIPTSGQISFSDFFCSSAISEIVVYITQNTANVNVSSLFGTHWTSSVDKRLVVNSGVQVYNTNPYAISNLNGYAMRIYDTFNGQLTIENLGTIIGAPGRRGGLDPIRSGESRTNILHGGQGGNAIYIGPTTYNGTVRSKTVYINNQGNIYAGGGGGGKGGSNASAIDPNTAYYNYRPYGSCCPLDAYVQGRAAEGGHGGFGIGYNVSSGTAGANGYYSGVKATVSMYSLGNNSFKFPPNSIVTINATISGQITHNISSNTTFVWNSNSSGIRNMTLAGTNSSITWNRYNSGFTGTLTKDPNQRITNNAVNSGEPNTVVKVTGGGPEQTPGQIKLVANGVNKTITIPTATGYTGGQGGSAGGSGSTGKGGGSPGGAGGYSIVGASRYVSYISQGSIAGQTT